MRIITGLLKGRRIDIPKKLDIRPTTDRVKEGMFSVIASHQYIQHSTVLDLFAGSGNLGFEALSRGARTVRFVDHSRKNVTYIEKTAEKFEMSDQIRTVTLDVTHFLEGPAAPADIILCDPPYKNKILDDVIEAVLEGGWLQPEGWLVAEHNKYYDFTDRPSCFKVKKYGRTFVSFFTNKS